MAETQRVTNIKRQRERLLSADSKCRASVSILR